MQMKRKLPWIITGKSLLAVGSIAMVALALVTYTATVTINFNAFFIQGPKTYAWSATTSSGLRYFPDGPNTGAISPNGTIIPSTTATAQNFSFVTQLAGKGYVQIAMGTAASTGDFQSFSVGVLTYNGTSLRWQNATLYTTSGFNVKEPNGFDGTSLASVAFIHVLGGSTIFYLIQVNYVLQGTPVDTTSTTVTFNFTPSLT